jgi:hypothetical protein
MQQNLVVGREGFEPPYSKRTDLQSAGFNHSPIFQGYKKMRAWVPLFTVYQVAGSLTTWVFLKQFDLLKISSSAC